jgi:hypothetical protein
VGGAFVKALIGTTMATIVIVARFTLVQADDVILGPIPTFLNMGLGTYYFIATCK